MSTLLPDEYRANGKREKIIRCAACSDLFYQDRKPPILGVAVLKADGKLWGVGRARRRPKNTPGLTPKDQDRRLWITPPVRALEGVTYQFQCRRREHTPRISAGKLEAKAIHAGASDVYI